MDPRLIALAIALQAANRPQLLAALQALAVERIYIRYAGRQGRCTHCLVSTVPADTLAAMLDTPVAQQECEASLAMERTVSLPLLAALKAFALHWVERRHPGWTTDDGGHGVMTVTVTSRQFTLEHDAQFTERFCYRLVD